MRASAFPPVLPVLLLLLGCAPPLADEPWRVTQRRVVAVLAEPPDAQPGSTVLLRAIIASPEGPVETAEVRWLRCDEQTPFSQNESTGLSCLAHLATAPAGATTTQVTIPSSACSVFGPDVATASARPRDPDATGGYYQPIGVELDGRGSFAFERLRCNPANVTSQIAQDFRRADRPNTNPVFSLLPLVGGEPVDLSELSPGAEVQLVADWSASPEESFPAIDPSTLGLTTLVEHYDVSWLVTQGKLDRSRSSTGQGHWTLPSTPGEGTVWAVLRDSRGGAAVVIRHARWGR